MVHHLREPNDYAIQGKRLVAYRAFRNISVRATCTAHYVPVLLDAIWQDASERDAETHMSSI